MSGRPRPAVVAILAAIVLPLVASAGAGAHGGTLLASAVTGPYRTQVTAAPLTEPGEPPAIDVTVYVTHADSGTPVDDATVRTTVQVDGRTVRPPVRAIGGGYEAVVPVQDAFTVGEQRVDVEVSGSRGSGRLTIAPRDPDGGGPPTALIAGTSVAAAALGLLVVRVRRRRAREDGAVAETGGA